MRTPALSLLLAFLVCSIPLKAGDQPWIELKSDHFTVLCNSGEKDAREAAVDLERIRLVLIKLFPAMKTDPNAPIVVFITADDALYGSLVPEYNKRSISDKPFSHFVTSRDLNLIASKSGIFQAGRTQSEVVLKEGAVEPTDYKMKWDYAGLMAGINFRRAPAWFRAGIGAFFGYSLITEDQAKVGLPVRRYAAITSRGLMIPFSKLVTMSTHSPEYNEEVQQHSFYAESWALFHYLMLADNGAYRSQLERYLQLLGSGKKRLDAAQEAFGDLGKLQDKLTVYYKSYAFPYASIQLPPMDPGQGFAVHTLTTGESDSWLAEYYLRFKRKTDAKPLLNAAMAENPVPARAHEAMGIYYLEQADYANAQKEFSAATAADSNLFLSFFYKGVLAANGKSGTEIPASAEADLRRALELNPRYAPASMALARVIIRRGGAPADAVPFARQAVESEYAVARYHIAYANILLQAGDAAKAEAEASLPLEDTLPASEEEDARAVLLLAQKCQSSPPCQPLGTNVSIMSVPPRSPALSADEANPSSNAPAQPATPPHSSMRGIVRSISCDSEERVLTFEVEDKSLTFNLTKKANISQPETYWLSPVFVDVCKNFVGEPGEVFFKSGQPDGAPLEATSLQILDHF